MSVTTNKVIFQSRSQCLHKTAKFELQEKRQQMLTCHVIYKKVTFLGAVYQTLQWHQLTGLKKNTVAPQQWMNTTPVNIVSYFHTEKPSYRYQKTSLTYNLQNGDTLWPKWRTTKATLTSQKGWTSEHQQSQQPLFTHICATQTGRVVQKFIWISYILYWGHWQEGGEINMMVVTV